ncbi:MAG: glycosyltransferase family 4 protein [Oscillospiraceae bacterium]|nr:glycosyltransferase family 4 protein [Oscillospiraceae bacterium]
MKTAIYIGNFKSSILDAQCQLVIGNCSILSQLGYQPVLIGNDSTLANPADPLSSKTILSGFPCYNIRFSKSIRDLMCARSTHQQIEKVLSHYADSLSVIISYGSPAFGIELLWLKQWCAQHHILFLANVVDLPATCHGTLPERIVKTLDRRMIEGTIIKHADGIISVSDYINRFYRKHTSVPTVILPPLKDTEDIPQPAFSDDDTVRIVYVGVPFPLDGRKMEEDAYKDRIDLFIDLLCSIRPQVPRFHLDIYGLTEEQYLRVVTRHVPLLEKHRDCIRFHGRICHEDSLKNFADADFSVLFRIKSRMTMAGFSSKLVESISCGTPVILTDTSDYLSYLKDGESCILLDCEDTRSCQETLKAALNLSKEEIRRRKANCFSSRIFDYRNYVEPMERFLNQVFEKASRN